jgi:hypothetical protein
MIKPGPKSELNEELSLEIRKMVLEGKSYADIRLILDINENTWDYWIYKDYQGLRVKLNEWKYERLLKKSERLSEEILDLNHLGDKGVDSKLLSIKQKESEFVRETLGKSNYAKRTEQTGKDGKDLIPLNINGTLLDKYDTNGQPTEDSEKQS